MPVGACVPSSMTTLFSGVSASDGGAMDFCVDDFFEENMYEKEGNHPQLGNGPQEPD